MVCKNVEKLINDYIDDQLSESQRSTFEAHLSTCLSCSQKVHELKEVVLLVKSIGQEELPNGFEARLKRAIETDELKNVASRRFTGFVPWVKWAGAAAAVLLVLFGSITGLLNLEILGVQPMPEAMPEEARIMMEAAPSAEEAAKDNATDADINAKMPQEPPRPAMRNYSDAKTEGRMYLAAYAGRINTESIDLRAKDVQVTLDTLRSIAEKHGIEILDASCQGITFRIDEEHRKILYDELSVLGKIVETGKEQDAETLSIMILYGFE